MADKKITIGEQFDKVRDFLLTNDADAALVDFIEERKAMHEKKNGNRKPTKVQIANEGLAADILAFLATRENPCSISDIIRDLPSCKGLSTPKVSAIVTKMKNAGVVERTEEKGKALFYCAKNEE